MYYKIVNNIVTTEDDRDFPFETKGGVGKLFFECLKKYGTSIGQVSNFIIFFNVIFHFISDVQFIQRKEISTSITWSMNCGPLCLCYSIYGTNLISRLVLGEN